MMGMNPSRWAAVMRAQTVTPLAVEIGEIGKTEFGCPAAAFDGGREKRRRFPPAAIARGGTELIGHGGKIEFFCQAHAAQ